MAMPVSMMTNIGLQKELEWLAEEKLAMEKRVKQHADRKRDILLEVQKRSSHPNSKAALSQMSRLSALSELKKKEEDISDADWVAVKKAEEDSGENGPQHDWEEQT
jgi:hypothetical protein